MVLDKEAEVAGPYKVHVSCTISELTGDKFYEFFREFLFIVILMYPMPNLTLMLDILGNFLVGVFQAALKEIGVSLRFMSLPSQAHENNIVDSKLPQLNRFYILVIFGYCIFLLFNARKEVCWYNRCSQLTSTDKIYALCTKLGFPPYNDLHIPFNQQNEYAIYTMLSTPSLRFSVIIYIMENLDNEDIRICNLCDYVSFNLCGLSWYGDMYVYSVINDRLVKTKSPVLSDSRVTTEVNNLSVTSGAVGKLYKYFYYFSHLCLDSELFLFDVSRFPTLFAVAMELDRGDSALYKYNDISGADRTIVRELLKLHRAAMAQSRGICISDA